MTKEEHDELLSKIPELQKEIEYIQNTTIKEMYINDLKDLRKDLKKEFEWLWNILAMKNTIIKENDNIQHKIVEPGFMYNVIKDYLLSKLDDEYFRKIYED